MLKRLPKSSESVLGVYHQMSLKHLHRYITEFVGRHNLRDWNTIKQMGALTTGMSGKRLQYQDLVAYG